MAPNVSGSKRTTTRPSGVSSTATAKEITSAYRKLAKKYHPDTNPGQRRRFKEISAAYDVLGDADQAQGVRRGARPGPAAGGFGGGFPGGFGGGGRRAPSGSRTWATSGDLFGGLFGRGRRGGGATPGPGGGPTWRPSCTSPSRTP